MSDFKPVSVLGESMISFIKKSFIMISCIALFVSCSYSNGLPTREGNIPNDAEEYVDFYNNNLETYYEKESEGNIQIKDEKKECNIDADCRYILSDVNYRLVKCVKNQCQFVRCPIEQFCYICHDGYCVTCSVSCKQDSDCPGGQICERYGYGRHCTACTVP